MQIKFNVSLKTAKKCFALINEDIPSDEEIETKLTNVVVDLSKYDDPDIKQAELGFTLMAISIAYDKALNA